MYAGILENKQNASKQGVEEKSLSGKKLESPKKSNFFPREETVTLRFDKDF